MKLKSFRTVLDLDVGESGRSEYRVGESGVTSLVAFPQYVELKVSDRRGNRTVLIPYAGIKWMVGADDETSGDSSGNTQGANRPAVRTK